MHYSNVDYHNLFFCFNQNGDAKLAASIMDKKRDGMLECSFLLWKGHLYLMWLSAKKNIALKLAIFTSIEFIYKCRYRRLTASR